MISYHPSSEELFEYAGGALATSNSVIIAGHLSYCNQCKSKYERLQAERACEWDLNLEADTNLPDLKPLLDTILADNTATPTIEPCKTTKIEIDKQVFHLPVVLARILDQGLNWRKFPGGISQAKCRLDETQICNFIYMKPGGKVPLHTHRGHEITLVLGGSFADELGSYHLGDFVQRDERDIHTSHSDKGCLCFAVQDNPVVFTSGLSRLFNPINAYLSRK